MRLAWAAIASVIVSATPSLAGAQGLALDRFNPAPAGDPMFEAPSPFTPGHAELRWMLLADYAHNPFVLVRASTGERVRAIVSDQLVLHIGASFDLWERVKVSVDLPIAVLEDGEGSTSQSFHWPEVAQLGDLRTGLRVHLFGKDEALFQLAIAGYLWFPTGVEDSFVSDDGTRAMPEVAVGGRRDRFVWTWGTGVELRPSQDFVGVRQGAILRSSAGAGVLLGDRRAFQLGPELRVATVLEDTSSRSVSAEALIDARYRLLNLFEFGLGLGPGLTRGVGTPDVRGVAMIAYAPGKRSSADRDGDRIPDASDACPDVPGVATSDRTTNGCPTDRDRDGIVDAWDACPELPGMASPNPRTNGCPDRDRDGIVDVEDACVDEPGPPNADKRFNGCPPGRDRDGDGVRDEVDACPDRKGVITADPKTTGCPPDTDGDGIADDLDACPKEKGQPDPNPTKNGCLKTVRVLENELVILTRVQFAVASSKLEDENSPLLDDVASALTQHPEILKLEVRGHTDSEGLARTNKILSQRRAESVVKELVKRNIDRRRLTATGFGQDVPIADNATEAGRQANRRVEFKITKKSAEQR